jgi:hypothetical protein
MPTLCLISNLKPTTDHDLLKHKLNDIHNIHIQRYAGLDLYSMYTNLNKIKSLHFFK